MSKTDPNTANERGIDRSYLDSLKTTSAKVRYLNSIGCTRSEISNVLYIRYQHVRNILITPIKS